MSAEGDANDADPETGFTALHWAVACGQLEAVAVREDDLDNNENNYNKNAYAGQLNSITHLRALSVPHDCGISGCVWCLQAYMCAFVVCACVCVCGVCGRTYMCV